MKKYTSKQKAWLALYKNRTGFDALMEEFESGEVSFYRAAINSCRWWEDHSNDALIAITLEVPGSEQASHERIKMRTMLAASKASQGGA